MSPIDGYQTVQNQQQDFHRDPTSNDQFGRSPDESKTALDFVEEIEGTTNPRL